MQSSTLRRLAGATLLGIATATPACQQYTPGDASAPRPPQYIALLVRNDGFLDANVYAALSTGQRGARLGMVTGHSAARLNVRLSDLQPGNVLVLRVHPIGGTHDWLSQSVIVTPPDYAELNLIDDANGRYEFSNLYSRVR